MREKREMDLVRIMSILPARARVSSSWNCGRLVVVPEMPESANTPAKFQPGVEVMVGPDPR